MSEEIFEANELMGRLAVTLAAAVLVACGNVPDATSASSMAFQLYDAVTAEQRRRESEANAIKANRRHKGESAQ